MKIGDLNITEEQAAKVTDLIEKVKPLLGNPTLTANPENRGLIYALVTIAISLIPAAFEQARQSTKIT